MKTKIIWVFCLLIALEIVLIGAIVTPRLAHATEWTKAVAAYSRNPANEPKEKRDKESRRVRRTIMLIDLIIGSVVVANSVAVWRVGRKIAAKA